MIKLIKKLCRIPKLWKATHKFEEAWDLTASGKDKESEEIFEKGETQLGELPYQYKIMKGYIKFRLEKREESIALFKAALVGIAEDEKLSTVDAQYLRAYISGPMRVYIDLSITDIESSELVEIADVPLDKVAETIKRKFPCRHHPEWNRHGVS